MALTPGMDTVTSLTLGVDTAMALTLGVDIVTAFSCYIGFYNQKVRNVENLRGKISAFVLVTVGIQNFRENFHGFYTIPIGIWPGTYPSYQVWNPIIKISYLTTPKHDPQRRTIVVLNPLIQDLLKHRHG